MSLHRHDWELDTALVACGSCGEERSKLSKHDDHKYHAMREVLKDVRNSNTWPMLRRPLQDRISGLLR